MLYGFLTDAYVELGNYKEAKLRPVDVRPEAWQHTGLTQAAYLRELFGDIDGSLDLMDMAAVEPLQAKSKTLPGSSQMAHLNLQLQDRRSGKLSRRLAMFRLSLCLRKSGE